MIKKVDDGREWEQRIFRYTINLHYGMIMWHQPTLMVIVASEYFISITIKTKQIVSFAIVCST